MVLALILGWARIAPTAGREKSPKELLGTSVHGVGCRVRTSLAALRHEQVRHLVVGRVRKEHPLNTLLQSCFLPAIRAQIELSKGNAGRAIELLEQTRPYELSTGLYPAYVRGLAYLRSRQGGAAATEFQRILDHRGLSVNSDGVPLARLGLARARAMKGDTSNARTAYQDFLALWKDADLDIPVLKEAKAEYAKLQ